MASRRDQYGAATTNGRMGVVPEGLVDDLRRGERDAFVRFYELFRRPIHDLVRRLTDGDAEAVTHEVFLSAYRQVLLHDGAVELRPLIYHTAIRACAAHPEGSEGRPTRRNDEASSPAPAATERLSAHFELALSALTVDHSLALLLHDVHGLRPDEMAHVLEVPEDAVNGLLFRAREEFRRAFREQSGDENRSSCRIAEQAAIGAVGRGLSADDRRKLREHAVYCRPCRKTMRTWEDRAVGLALFLPFAPLPESLNVVPVFGTPLAGYATGTKSAASPAAARSVGAAGAIGGLRRALRKTGALVTSKAAAYALALVCVAASAGVIAYVTQHDWTQIVRVREIVSGPVRVLPGRNEDTTPSVGTGARPANDSSSSAPAAGPSAQPATVAVTTVPAAAGSGGDSGMGGGETGGAAGGSTGGGNSPSGGGDPAGGGASGGETAGEDQPGGGGETADDDDPGGGGAPVDPATDTGPPGGSTTIPSTEPTTDEPPSVDPPSVDPPIVDPPSDDPPSEDPPGDDPPSDDPQSDDPPSDDPPSDDPPSDDPPSDDPPSDDPSSDDPPSDDPPSDDPPSVDPPIVDPPCDDPPCDDPRGKDPEDDPDGGRGEQDDGAPDDGGSGNWKDMQNDADHGTANDQSRSQDQTDEPRQNSSDACGGADGPSPGCSEPQQTAAVEPPQPAPAEQTQPPAGEQSSPPAADQSVEPAAVQDVPPTGDVQLEQPGGSQST
jgi:DNA-directed RNA polymerase specialized sigma24 family protein